MAEAFPYVEPGMADIVQPQQMPATTPPPMPEGGMPGVPPEVQNVFRPPVDQAEYQARVGLWQQFQDRVKADPNLQAALLRFGVAMAQPRRSGQTVLGHTAGAIGEGANFYQAGVQQQTDQSQKERELATREQLARSQIGLQGAQTEGAQATAAATRTNTGIVQKEAPIRLRGLTAEVDLAEQALPLKIQKMGAELVGQNAENSYRKVLTDLKTIEVDLTRRYGELEAKAKLAQMGADVVLKNAQAEYHKAHAKVVGQQLANDKVWQQTGTKQMENGDVVTDGINKSTGETRRITSTAPMPLAEAKSRAMQEVKIVMDTSGSGSWLGTGKKDLEALSRHVGQPVKTEAEAVRVLMNRFSEGKTVVKTIRADGTVTTNMDSAAGATDEESMRKAAVAAHARGEKVDMRQPGFSEAAAPQMSIAELRSKGWQPNVEGYLNDPTTGKPVLFVDKNGNQRPVGAEPNKPMAIPAGNVLGRPNALPQAPAATPAPVEPTVGLPADAEKLLSPLLGGAWEIKVPGGKRGGGATAAWARPLDGTTYRTRSEAMQALRNAYGK